MTIKRLLPWLILAGLIVSSNLTVAQSDDVNTTTSRAADDRVVLGEMVTGTWCDPCINSDGGLDRVLDDPSYFDQRFVAIEYHTGDEYQIPETAERNNYYFISDEPTLVIDGIEQITGTQNSVDDYAYVYASAIDSRPPTAFYSFAIDWTIEEDTATYSISVKVENTVPFTYQGLSAYAVVVEDQNIKLDSDHILRMTAVKMPMNDVYVPVRGLGDSTTYDGTFQVDPDWVRKDLALVFFIQSDTSREVLQAGIGYPELKGPQVKNSPPQYIGGDLDFSMEEDGVDNHIYMTEVFSDPDKDPLEYGAKGSVHISAIVDADATLRVTPDADWHGSETISISAKDDANPSVSHAVTVTVTAVNDPPRITGRLSGLELDEDSSSVTSPISSIFNDPDGDGLTYMVENMVHLKALKNSDNTLTIEPTEDWYGYENLVIKASDGEYETVYDDTVRVSPVNDEPTISGYFPEDYMEVEEGSSITLSVEANDIEGDTLTYVWEVDGTPSTIKRSTFTYEPNFGDSGEHSVLVKVSDGEYLTSHAFHLIVIKGNRAPTVKITSPVSGQGFLEGDQVLFMSEVSDPDDPYGRYLEYEWDVDGRMMSNEPSFSYKPDKGTYIVTLKVSDGEFEVEDTVNFAVKDKGSSGLPGFEVAPVLISFLIIVLVLRRRP